MAIHQPTGVTNTYGASVVCLITQSPGRRAVDTKMK